jgi:hypothetical protein
VIVTAPLTLPHKVVVLELPTCTRPACLHCGDSLDLCQPCTQRPDRLVGYCAGCDVMYHTGAGLLIEIAVNGLTAEARGQFAAQRHAQGQGVHRPHLPAP